MALRLRYGIRAREFANLIIFILAIISIFFQDNTVKALVGFAVAGKVLTR